MSVSFKHYEQNSRTNFRFVKSLITSSGFNGPVKFLRVAEYPSPVPPDTKPTSQSHIGAVSISNCETPRSIHIVHKYLVGSRDFNFLHLPQDIRQLEQWRH
jgi:hypothetical protein